MFCENCGSEYDQPVAGRCPHCGTRVADDAPGAWTSPPPPVQTGGGMGGGPGGGVPWEDTSLPFFARLWQTIKEVVTNPVGFFSNLPDGSIGQPLLYGLIIYMIPGMLGLFLNLLLQGAALMTMIPAGEGGEAAIGMGAIWGMFFLFMVVVLPILILVFLFVYSGIAHLLLMLVGDGQRGFPVTFRIVCYGGTPQLLGFIPCVGFLAGIWALVLYVLGAIHGHNTDTWRAVVALVGIPIVCLGCCILGLFWTAADWGQWAGQ